VRHWLDEIGPTCSSALLGSGGGDRSISNFVVAIPNTKLRIGAEGRPARPIRPACNRKLAPSATMALRLVRDHMKLRGPAVRVEDERGNPVSFN
jgi:hypothetical protein